ncbi:uncharacterized protein LOC144555652 [Carex rostrata]
MRVMGIANDMPRYQVGKPYPPAFDIPRYPPTYFVPLFTKFSGDGINDLNPKQHINHYMIQCWDSARNPAFLCRQFSRSLSGPAFDWYCSLEPGSVRSWDHMVSLFIERFATTTNQVRLADLAWMKPKPGESAMSYIIRWRNMSVRASHSMPEKEAIEFIIRNLSGKMREWLSVANVSTYQELIDTVSRIGHAKLDKPAVSSSRQRNDFSRRNDAKAVYAVRDDGMKPSNEENRRVDNRPVPFNDRGNQGNRFPMTLDELKNKKYSFKREKTFKIFKQALEDGLELPICKRPEEASMVNHPKYCPYHRILGHTIEDCWAFKDLVEQKIKEGRMHLAPSAMQTPASHEQVNVISHIEVTEKR